MTRRHPLALAGILAPPDAGAVHSAQTMAPQVRALTQMPAAR